MEPEGLGTGEDRTLVDAFVREGDEHAFAVLYRRFTPRMYALAWRMLGGNEADACDAVQEAWVRAARGLDGFEWRAALGTWLSGIAINCCRERLRERQKHGGAAVDIEGMAGRTTTPPRERLLDLDRAIASLPDGFREVLVLHDVEGRTHEEIAEMLGIEPGTSKSQLSRARARVRERISVRQENEP